jgi:hypothetical protein
MRRRGLACLADLCLLAAIEGCGGVGCPIAKFRWQMIDFR